MRIRNAGIFLLALAALVMAGCSTGLTAEEVGELIRSELASLPTAEPGPTGAQGEGGSSGAAGLQGPMGDTGATGERGQSGGDGQVGQSGPQGEQGVTGPAGSTGPTGQTGQAGQTGLPGIPGPAGPQGESAIGDCSHNHTIANSELVHTHSGGGSDAGGPTFVTTRNSDCT